MYNGGKVIVTTISAGSKYVLAHKEGEVGKFKINTEDLKERSPELEKALKEYSNKRFS